jgi:hypothetical protein
MVDVPFARPERGFSYEETSSVGSGLVAVRSPGRFWSAQAMEIRQFDKMGDRDQSEYIGNLIVGAESVLTDESKADLAAKVKYLFTAKLGNDADVIGMVEFERNLALARVADAERAAQDPKAHRLEVEDAMLVTLQKNNIPLSQGFIKSFRVVNNGFRPQYLPQQ